MEQFKEAHAAAFPKNPAVPQGGYPDTGNGYYGKKLTYKLWYEMNNGQRAQMNFLEQITFIIGTTVIATAYQPCRWVAFCIVVGFFFGRIIFSIGYTRCGPNAILPGALIMDLALAAQFVLSVVSVVLAIRKNDW